MSVQTIWVADHVAMTSCIHKHTYYQLIFCKGGHGAVEVNGKIYPAEAGRAFFVRPMEMHGITQKDGLCIAEVKFRVQSEALAEALATLDTEFFADAHDALGESYFAVIREGLYETLYKREGTNCALELFLIRLIRSKTDQAESRSARLDEDFYELENGGLSEEQKDAEMMRVVDYVENHLSEAITLDDLTRLVHFDKSYLIVRFKEKWGMPPMKYVNHLRIERAKVLLCVTQKSVTEIAREVGFGSVHYFSRFFKEKENLTPNDFRVMKQKNKA